MKSLLSFLIVALLSIPAQAEQTLEFSYMGGKLSHRSLAVLEAAYAKLGIEVAGDLLPAARALVESNEGRTDGEVHRIKDIETLNRNLIRIETPINTLEGMAVTCKDSVIVDGVENLRQYRIGIKTGQRFAEQLVAGMPHVTSMTDVELLFELLREDRLDIVIADRPWALLQKGMEGSECLQIKEPPLVKVPLFHFLHKRHKNLVPTINEVLKKMEESGESGNIRQSADKTYDPSIIQ